MYTLRFFVVVVCIITKRLIWCVRSSSTDGEERKNKKKETRRQCVFCLLCKYKQKIYIQIYMYIIYQTHLRLYKCVLVPKKASLMCFNAFSRTSDVLLSLYIFYLPPSSRWAISPYIFGDKQWNSAMTVYKDIITIIITHNSIFCFVLRREEKQDYFEHHFFSKLVYLSQLWMFY